ncbi:MAG: hypothetical protein HS114_22750 [Anaerolineales bacterium]|nr:hypothetical protein [Anaerolineales bacterium]
MSVKVLDAPHLNTDGIEELDQYITHPNALKQGHFVTSYHRKEGHLTLSHAFRNDLPPSVRHNMGLIDGKKTPTPTYFLTYHMKHYGIPYGGLDDLPDEILKKVELRNVQNIETILQLNWLQKHFLGADHEELFRHIYLTHLSRPQIEKNKVDNC